MLAVADLLTMGAMDDATPSFAVLLTQLAVRDAEAAREIHRRYTPRLVALARAHLDTALRQKSDPESAVQSALGSFFRRIDAGEFRLGKLGTISGACWRSSPCAQSGESSAILPSRAAGDQP